MVSIKINIIWQLTCLYVWLGFQGTFTRYRSKGIIIQLTSCPPFIDKNISQKCLEKVKIIMTHYCKRKFKKYNFRIYLGLNRLVDDEGNIY